MSRGRFCLPNPLSLRMLGKGDVVWLNLRLEWGVDATDFFSFGRYNAAIPIKEGML